MTATTVSHPCRECGRRYVPRTGVVTVFNQVCAPCASRDTVLVMRRLSPDEAAPPVPSRPGRVASWLVWNCREVGGVTVPALAAVAVTPWAGLVAAAVAAGWASRAAWQARKQAAIRAGRDLPAAEAALDTTSEASTAALDDTSPGDQADEGAEQPTSEVWL